MRKLLLFEGLSILEWDFIPEIKEAVHADVKVSNVLENPTSILVLKKFEEAFENSTFTFTEH